MSLPQLDGVDDFLPFALDPPPSDFDFFIGQRSPYRLAAIEAARTVPCRAHLECTDAFFFGPYLQYIPPPQRRAAGIRTPEQKPRRIRYVDLMNRAGFVGGPIF